MQGGAKTPRRPYLDRNPFLLPASLLGLVTRPFSGEDDDEYASFLVRLSYLFVTLVA